MITADAISPQSTMREILEAFPGAQRALFRGYHIGGCSSCGVQPDETLDQVCQRSGGRDPGEVLEHIKTSHEQDENTLMGAQELSDWLKKDRSVRLVDVRS